MAAVKKGKSQNKKNSSGKSKLQMGKQSSYINNFNNNNMKKKSKNIINLDIDALERLDDFEDFEDFEAFNKLLHTGKKKKEDTGIKGKPTQSGKAEESLQSTHFYGKKQETIKGNTVKDKAIKDKAIKDKSISNKTTDNKVLKEKFIKNNTIKNKTIKAQEYRFKSANDRELPGKDLKKKSSDVKDKTVNNTSATSCPVLKKCGSCQLIHLDYEKQLMQKQKLVEDLLKKYAKVEPILGMENPYHYRNKVHAVFDHDRKGNPISGVYEAGTHRVVPVDSCLIEDRKADDIIVSIRGMLKSFKIKTYDEDTEYGLLRHVLIRKGFKSGEIMVVLVLASPIFPSKNNFVKALLKLHPEITTIVLNVNDKRTSMVLGEKEQVIYGKGYIEDSLCGKTFRISPKSFYQVNPVQTEILYGKAIELAGLTGGETVIDAYCGIGTIGLIASDYVKKVIGVEMNQDAVRDAVTNAKRNQVTNVEFYNKDAGEFMSQLAAQNQSADVVFLDPPRAGSDEKFLDSLCAMAPEKVVYISCNPVTLERDLGYLVKKRYKVERIVPVDMFPGTGHCEICVEICRK